MLHRFEEALQASGLQDLVEETTAHLASTADPEPWCSPTNRDLAELKHRVQSVFDLLEDREAEQERGRLVDGGAS